MRRGTRRRLAAALAAGLVAACAAPIPTAPVVTLPVAAAEPPVLADRPAAPPAIPDRPAPPPGPPPPAEPPPAAKPPPVVRPRPEPPPTAPVPPPTPARRPSPAEAAPQPLTGERVWAVEALRCEGEAGVWALVIEGELVGTAPDGLELRARRRFGLRYWPAEEGVDATDWFCAPRRRFCYSEVRFTDWGGRLAPGELLVRPKDRVFPASLRLPVALSGPIRATCGS